MDCNIKLDPSSYTYNGIQCRPRITGITYNSGSDRDGTSIFKNNGSATLSVSDVTIDGYGDNVHCKEGTVTVTGNRNSQRTSPDIKGSNSNVAVGTKILTFAINKANLTAPVSADKTNVYSGQPVVLSLSTYTSATAGTGSLSALRRESSQKTEGPQVTWEVTQGTGSFSGSGLNTTFTPTSTGTVKVQAVLTDMNDFKDYTTEPITLTIQEKTTLNAFLSRDTPHPKMPVTVNLPTGVTSAAYQWYADGVEIEGATGASYTPSNGDIGKSLSVKITPDVSSVYAETTVTAKNLVEDHQYSTNGFCTFCDEYEPAVLSGDTYQIGNGGQMFWLAALINGDKTHAEFEKRNTYAKGILTADISLESREWKPIYDLNGSLDGQSHTITNMQITQTTDNGGFVGTSNGVISNFTLEGDIKLPDTGGTNIGGAVGYMNGGTVSNIVSRVTISNNNNSKEYKHVGGVIGNITTSETTVTKCVFKGSVTLSNSTDCIGGVVGYSNSGGRISYCANLGTVTATAQDAYVGGILGYMNNANVTIRNCYNYGKVQNSGGNYCGAIVGRLRSHSAAKITDNYYLNTSASSAFGSGSNGTSAKAPFKDETAFASGEVCYLVNGSSSADDVIWRQDVDNGNTPYDAYPVFEGGIVLQNRAHHDCTTGEYTYAYSNSASDAMDHINHHYENGFCTCCDAREPANQTDGVYQITNGGQLFWFAEQLNSGDIFNSSAAVLTADIDLEGSENGQAAGYDGITKDRNFPGIGTNTTEYTGTFNGGGHTVSNLYIEWTDASPSKEDIGLFGRTILATVSDMTVQGRISMTGTQKVDHVGGIVAYASCTTVSKVYSYVDISNETNMLAHVGGVVGSANDGGSIKQCMYFGKIDLHNSHDCIGGIAGYTNSTAISYCANHGSVKTGSQSGYTGGILGYINNNVGSVRNCYNYGSVQNGGCLLYTSDAADD